MSQAEVKKNIVDDYFLTSEQQAKKCLTMNSYNRFSLPLKVNNKNPLSVWLAATRHVFVFIFKIGLTDTLFAKLSLNTQMISHLHILSQNHYFTMQEEI